MPDINDIHKFFEANLPGYRRRDNLSVMRFFLQQIGLTGKKPIRAFLAHFRELKEFVCFEWEGVETIQNKPPQAAKTQGGGDGYGRCSCGGFMVKRKNRADGSLFLGCNRWPKCNKTNHYLL